jgi:hypothetical protein
MANGKPKPRMDYAALIRSELNKGTKGSSAWTKVVFDRIYNMMKTDPYYKDGDTFDYNRMQMDAVMGVTSTDRAGIAAAGNSILDLMEKDPIWQQGQYEGEVSADVAELNQQDVSELQQLDKQLNPQAKPKGLTSKQIQAMTAEQGNWVTLSSGKKVLIKKK